MTVSVTITLKGTKFPLQITKPTSIVSLKQQILILGSLPPTTLIKLICKGKTFSDDNILSPSTHPKSLKIMAVVSNESDVQTLEKDVIFHNDMNEKRDKFLSKGNKSLQQNTLKINNQTHHSNPNKFFNISTLKFLPDEPTAKSILKQLASDPGVLHCLKLHDWSVGTLAELYPKGKVGVSDVCVMGLNTNAGQKIELRVSE